MQNSGVRIQESRAPDGGELIRVFFSRRPPISIPRLGFFKFKPMRT
jgi:hypothetical protein